MSIAEYTWSAADQFVGRVRELDRLEAWWRSAAAEPINLFGRRRVGKSWLFRRFAQGKPAVLLVAEQTTASQQLSKIAEQLEPTLGIRPDIRDIGGLFTILYQLARADRVLVVVDEFPYLLGNSPAQVTAALSSVQAVMEQYREASKVKLILCGSAVAQMEELQSERSPLHGRLQPFALKPLEFAEGRQFMPTLGTVEQFTRFSVAGGMPRYLSMLGSGDLARTLANEVVDRNSPLFNEPLSILQSEVREPAVYLAILDVLSSNPLDTGTISQRTGADSKTLSPYLERLAAVGLIRRRLPLGADPRSRSGQWLCDDGFVRFWFRFVHPYQADLEAGADALAHVKHHVLPELADHTGPSFEQAFRRAIRQDHPEAAQVAPWWGPALHVQRRAGARSTEEIDAIGIKGRTVLVVGEAKWTNKVLPMDVLANLREFKIPALAQDGFTLSKDLKVILSSRSGFSRSVLDAAAADRSIRLVPAEELLERLQ